MSKAHEIKRNHWLAVIARRLGRSVATATVIPITTLAMLMRKHDISKGWKCVVMTLTADMLTPQIAMVPTTNSDAVIGFDIKIKTFA
jgi:hypothetical protein